MGSGRRLAERAAPERGLGRRDRRGYLRHARDVSTSPADPRAPSLLPLPFVPASSSSFSVRRTKFLERTDCAEFVSFRAPVDVAKPDAAASSRLVVITCAGFLGQDCSETKRVT